MNFIGPAKPLSQAGFETVRDALGLPAPVLWAVLKTETQGCGFLPNRQPRILYERHVFHARTQGRFAAFPTISSPIRGGYLGGRFEYDRLAQALKLDATAALESTSWGIGQILGQNAALAGFATVETLVEATTESEDDQLQAMAGFIRSQQLNKFLSKRDWAGFALRYNGSDYKTNNYDTLLGSAYAAYSISLPNLKVREAQLLLYFLGYDIGVIDGIIGKRTRSGILDFREKNGLGTSLDVDDALIAALTTSVEDLTKI